MAFSVSRIKEGQGQQQFEISLKQLLTSINNMMEHKTDHTLAVQGAALKFISFIIGDVMRVFDPVELRYQFCLCCLCVSHHCGIFIEWMITFYFIFSWKMKAVIIINSRSSFFLTWVGWMGGCSVGWTFLFLDRISVWQSYLDFVVSVNWWWSSLKKCLRIASSKPKCCALTR